MKKTHIAIIVVIAISIAILISRIGDFGSYNDFKTAQLNLGNEVTVIAKLELEKGIDFNPRKVLLSFTATDDKGVSSMVYYNNTKPQDFEKSEEITLTGYATDTAFIANKILMKCPSKYNEQNEVEGNTDSYTDAVTDN